MNRRLRGDLARWERGALSFEDLVRRHPEATPLVETHAWVSLLASESRPESDALESWAALVGRLRDHDGDVPPPPPPPPPKTTVRRIMEALITGAAA